MRVELTTFTLARGEHTIASADLPEVTAGAKCACISACTRDTEMGNDKIQGGENASDFATALALISRLPLSDIEKAEAVRRLLASNSVANYR